MVTAVTRLIAACSWHPLLTAVLVSIFLLRLLRDMRTFCALKLHGRYMQRGDYDGALRVLRWMSLGMPDPWFLRAEGLVLSLAGRPADAARLYRMALAKARGRDCERERLHACLGYALLDLRKYDEAERCFHDAIEAGDTTGNSQDGLAEVRLYQGIEPEQALHYARQAAEHARRRPDGRIPGAYYGDQAWALALLGRRDEANEALQRALADSWTLPFGKANSHWRAGMVLLALEQSAEARRHFELGRDADPRGQSGRRCGERLRQM